jgi:hypothetical protein
LLIINPEYVLSPNSNITDSRNGFQANFLTVELHALFASLELLSKSSALEQRLEGLYACQQVGATRASLAASEASLLNGLLRKIKD